jgi:hypothetical protein
MRFIEWYRWSPINVQERGLGITLVAKAASQWSEKKDGRVTPAIF